MRRDTLPCWRTRHARHAPEASHRRPHPARGFFLDVLRRGFSAAEARSQLDTAVDWGRYAELYDYDSDDEELTPEPGAQDSL